MYNPNNKNYQKIPKNKQTIMYQSSAMQSAFDEQFYKTNTRSTYQDYEYINKDDNDDNDSSSYNNSHSKHSRDNYSYNNKNCQQDRNFYQQKGAYTEGFDYKLKAGEEERPRKDPPSDKGRPR
jgi:hypothetical protein